MSDRAHARAEAGGDRPVSTLLTAGAWLVAAGWSVPRAMGVEGDGGAWLAQGVETALGRTAGMLGARLVTAFALPTAAALVMAWVQTRGVSAAPVRAHRLPGWAAVLATATLPFVALVGAAMAFQAPLATWGAGLRGLGAATVVMGLLDLSVRVAAWREAHTPDEATRRAEQRADEGAPEVKAYRRTLGP